MRSLDDLIDQATRHVETGRGIITRHRARMAVGRVSSGADRLLRTFEDSQLIFERDLARLIGERDERRRR
ncbi:MAG: hypothetical protein ABW175_02790 [Bradyrhizobium sp.]